jgi:hypothetical protein
MTNEWQKTKPARCQGTITEEHTDTVAEVFGAEVAERLANATEGETFLNILFQMNK